MAIASVIVFLLSLLSFIVVLVGITLFFAKKTPHETALKKVSQGSIAVFFIYVLYREVLTFLNINRFFMYETELFAYLGLLAWLYLLQKNTHRREYRVILFGLALLAIVFISFYSIVFIEKLFHLCGITQRCIL